MNFIIGIIFELKYFVIFFVLIGFVGSAFALDDETLHPAEISLEEHYKIEILGLKDEYMTGEEYSFYYVISGYGYSCANHQSNYPDENGNIIHVGAEVLCAPEKSMYEFNLNPLEGKRTLGNTGIKKPGTYTITVTFEKPNKYYPTTITKEFRVVESIAENFIELSPLKQFNSGVPADQIQCKENFVLLQKYNGSPACVKPNSVIDLMQRNWMMIEEIDGYAIDYEGDVKHLPFADICTNEMKIILLTHSNISLPVEEFVIEDLELPSAMNPEDFERCAHETEFTKSKWNMVSMENPEPYPSKCKSGPAPSDDHYYDEDICRWKVMENEN